MAEKNSESLPTEYHQENGEENPSNPGKCNDKDLRVEPESELNLQMDTDGAQGTCTDGRGEAGADSQVCGTNNGGCQMDTDGTQAKKPTMAKMGSEMMRRSDKGMKEENADDADVYSFPKSLADFKYCFNANGELRHTDTDEPFEFSVREDHSYNQRRYEAVGEIITEYVYELLESRTKLKKVFVPIDAKESQPSSFVFVSKDLETNMDKLLILIHGSGVVRAGQWTRKLIMNECLDNGTQLPYIEKAVEAGYAVIVLNTNRNYEEINGKRIAIKENSSPESHASYVWKHLISKAPAKDIAIVAHSYGGVVTTHMAIEKKQDFEKRVFAVAFTDSVHSLALHKHPKYVATFFKQHVKNWVTSDKPLDTALPKRGADCPCVSAGTTKHEVTSCSSIESVFKFLNEEYASRLRSAKETK